MSQGCDFLSPLEEKQRQRRIHYISFYSTPRHRSCSFLLKTCWEWLEKVNDGAMLLTQLFS
jgi:hypothetical protein